MMLYLYILLNAFMLIPSMLGDEMEEAVAEESKERCKKGMELEKRKQRQMQIDGQTTAVMGREIIRRKRVEYSPD